jgi:hypothetical protein
LFSYVGSRTASRPKISSRSALSRQVRGIILSKFILCKLFVLDDDSLNAISRFSSELRRRYPNKITSEGLWVPLSAGGLNLKVQFLYGDLTEYVGMFVAIGDTSGRSG